MTKVQPHLLLFILCHTMKMKFLDPCPGEPMRPNNVHLLCMTSLIISMQLHPMSKGKQWVLNSTKLNIKESVEDGNLRSQSYKHLLLQTFYLICPLVFLIFHNFFLGFYHTSISPGKGSIPARTLFLRLLNTSPGITVSHTMSLEVLHSSVFVFLLSLWERKVMCIPAHLYKHMVLFSIFYSFSPFSFQFRTNEVPWFVMAC